MGVSNGRVGGAGVAVSSGRWVEQGWDLCIRLYPSIQRRYSRFNSLVKSSWEFYYICMYVHGFCCNHLCPPLSSPLPFPPLPLLLLPSSPLPLTGDTWWCGCQRWPPSGGPEDPGGQRAVAVGSLPHGCGASSERCSGEADHARV